MKHLLFILFSAFAALCSAAPLNPDSKVLAYPIGTDGAITDSTPTYALNNSLTGVASTAVDLSATGQILVCITGTAGTSPIVRVSFDNLTYGAFAVGPYNLGAGCWPIQAAARYVKFYNAATVPTGRVSLNYMVQSQPATAVTIGSTVTVAGTVAVSGGTLTISAGTSTIGAVGVTSTTYPSWTILSNTTRTISAPVALNLTSVAGSSGIMKYQVGASNSNSAGFYWDVTANTTWVGPRNFYSTSTTAFIDDYLTAGTHLNLSPASATDITCTAQIIIWKLTQVVP